MRPPLPHAGALVGRPARALQRPPRRGANARASRAPKVQRRRHDSLLSWFERLIRRRKECSELGWGSFELLDAGEAAVFVHRAVWNDAVLVTVHNFSDAPMTARLALDAGSALVDLFEDERVARDDGSPELPLEPYGQRWFRVAT